MLAKQHRAGLQIGYSPFCKADSAEVSALMRRPAAVDFAPLALYPELEELWIDELPWETTEIKNVEQLYAIPKLKNLSIWDKQMPRLDVSRFIALESLQANPADPKQIINIGKAAGLRLLSMYSYKGKDLTEFTSLKNLVSIDLINPAIGSLNGLEQMPQLEGLELMDTRNLKDVSLIGELPTQNRLPKLRSRCCRKNFKPIRNVLEPCASNNGRRNRQPENHKTCFQAASNPPPAHKHSCHAIGVTMFQKTTRPAQPAPPAKQEILDGAQVNDAQDELERYGKTPAKEYSWRQALLQAYLLVWAPGATGKLSPSAVIGQINENIARLQELAVLIRAEKEQNPPVLY